MALFNGIRQTRRGGNNAGRGDQPYSAYKPALPKMPGMPAPRQTQPQQPKTLPRMPSIGASSQSTQQPSVFDPKVLGDAEKTIESRTNANRNIKLPDWSGDITKLPNEEARNDHFAVRNNMDAIDKAGKVKNEQLGLLKQKQSADAKISMQNTTNMMRASREQK